jgi:isovaleryl-CoA dehydrogenase
MTAAPPTDPQTIIDELKVRTADIGREESINILRATLGLTIEGAEQMYDSHRRFCQLELRTRDDGLYGHMSAEERKAFDHGVWKILAKQKCLGIATEEKYGGQGLPLTLLLRSIETISANSGSVGLSVIANIELCLGRISKHGNEAQKKEFIQKIVDGDYIGALAMSEANAGSSVITDMKTTATPAVRDGKKGFILKGSKLWITNGARYDEKGNKVTADVLLVYAKTGDKVTAFLVRAGTPGFNAGYKVQKETMKDSETWELELDDCFVPKEDILGGPENLNRGSEVLAGGLITERLALSAGAIGLAQAAIDEAIPHVVQRDQDGIAIGYNQALAHKLADMQARVSMARKTLYMTSQMYDQGIPVKDYDAAMVFLESSKMAKDVTRGAQEALGGMGLTVEKRMARLVRDAQLYATGGGTEDIRREVVARWMVPGYGAFVKWFRKLREMFTDKTALKEENMEAKYEFIKQNEGKIKEYLKNEFDFKYGEMEPM